MTATPRATANGPIYASGESTIEVLFIHPSYPSQFTAIAAELNRRPGYRCTGLTGQVFLPAVPAESDVVYYGFASDGQVTDQTYPFAGSFEAGMRNARGIANALLTIPRNARYDVVIGHASFGSSLYLGPLLDSAIIAYGELPGYQAAAARPCFPLTVDQALAGQSLEALHYLAMLQADLCIVPSAHARSLYPAELQPKIRVQMEGFDAGTIPDGSRSTRQALGLPADRPIVGFFSRTLEAVRGFDIFLRVAHRLHEMAPEVAFVVIGEERTLYGNETAYLDGKSFKEFALAQTGVPAELFHWYPLLPYERFREYVACLDLVILPLFEGAANWSVFEAMALGRPILASNRCFVPEAIRHGRDGMLLAPYDVEGYARHALALLRDRRRARLLGRSAQERVRQKFSVARAADGYQRIIEEVLRQRRESPVANAVVSRVQRTVQAAENKNGGVKSNGAAF